VTARQQSPYSPQNDAESEESKRKSAATGVVGICVATAASNLVGMAGYLALSVWVLHETGSYALSSALFGCQWVLPLLWPTGMARLTAGRRPAAVAAMSEWTGAILSLALLAAVAVGSVPFALVLMTARGFCDGLTRTSASLVFKLGGEPASAIERNVSRIEFWRVVGTSAAGVLFSLVGDRGSTAVFLVASCAVLAMTGGLYHHAATATAQQPAEGSSPGTTGLAALRAGLRAGPVARVWLWQLGLVASFQGLHNAIRIAYPEQQLGEGVSGVGIVSAVSTVGVLCGGWIASRRRALDRLRPMPGPLLVAVVGVVGVSAVLLPVAVPSYALYFVFMLLFETVFMVFNLHVVTATTQQHAPALLGFRSTLLGGSTLAGLAVASLLLTQLSAAWSTVGVVSAIVALSCLLSRRRQSTTNG
jgi:hypothetical protein